MTAVADITFHCPCCDRPLMAEEAHIGIEVDCPHCFQLIEIPRCKAVDKDAFDEPRGLRRVLLEVRDREWEWMRRKLLTARARAKELEAVIAAKAAASQPAEDAEALRRENAELQERLAQANQAIAAGRKQHELAVEKLRRDVETEQQRGRGAAEEVLELRIGNALLRDELGMARRRLAARELHDETFGKAFADFGAHLGDVALRRAARLAVLGA